MRLAVRPAPLRPVPSGVSRLTKPLNLLSSPAFASCADAVSVNLISPPRSNHCTICARVRVGKINVEGLGDSSADQLARDYVSTFHFAFVFQLQLSCDCPAWLNRCRSPAAQPQTSRFTRPRAVPHSKVRFPCSLMGEPLAHRPSAYTILFVVPRDERDSLDGSRERIAESRSCHLFRCCQASCVS